MTRALLIWTLLFSVSSPAGATPSDPAPCFKLDQVNLKTLRPARTATAEDQSSSGTEKDTDLQWAEASGLVPKPLEEVLTRLMDPMTTRDPEITRLETSVVKIPGALLKQSIGVKVKPIFFLTLEWLEEWMFAEKPGNGPQAREVVISYQKISGTSHIRHFCGNMTLRQIGPNNTSVSIYEEIIADRRKAEDVERGLQGTLKVLRK